MPPSSFDRTRLQQILVLVIIAMSIAAFVRWGGMKISAVGPYVVNSVGNANDSDLTDGTCETLIPGECTLRAAVEQANAGIPGPDLIKFDAAKFASPVTITLTDVLTITDALTIEGPGSSLLLIDGKGMHRHFVVESSVAIKDLSLVNGFSQENGGSILIVPQFSYTTGAYNLDLDSVLIRGSGARNGGAIYAPRGSYSTVNVALRDVTLSSNEAISNTIFGAGAGGAVFFSGNTLAVVNSTFSANSADQYGGAIAHAGSGNVTILNSTLSGNRATVLGGGLYNIVDAYVTTTVTITNSTIVSNVAGSGGGGVANAGAYLGEAEVRSVGSIIAGNYIAGTLAPNDCDSGLANGGQSVFTSLGHNLTVTGTSTNCTFDSTIGDIEVAQGTVFSRVLDQDLAENGGPTATHALLPGSPAVDGASACASPTADQRGTPRPIGAACDIGAYEAVFPALSVTKTVGLEPSRCASSSSVDVGYGASVYYCITLANIGNVTLTEHTVNDPRLNVNVTIPFTLAPGRSVTLTADSAPLIIPALGPVISTGDLTNTVTISSRNVQLADIGVAPPVTATAVANMRQISITVDISQVGNDEIMMRTVTATVYHQNPNNRLAGKSVAFEVTGGTTVPATSTLTSDNGQAVFVYVSRAPRSGASKSSPPLRRIAGCKRHACRHRLRQRLGRR